MSAATSPAAAKGRARIGGHVVADSLAALGARAAFGVPGVHALPIWDGLRGGPIDLYGSRTELCAGFAADGYARSSGRPGVLLLSTGPGALNSLTAIMEAASSHVPVVAISSQIPSELIGRGRGYLHELPDQIACFAPIVKHAARAPSVESIPEVLARAWRVAITPPAGPVFVEVPVDVLRAPAPASAHHGPETAPLADGTETAPLADGPVQRQCAPAVRVLDAARLLAAARRPAIWAGGGVIRAGAQPELRELAELLEAPVVTTYMGKGALGDEHPLAVGSGCDEAAVQELLSGADVLLCAGTELGEQTTSGYSLDLRGRLIHLDAAPERVGATYASLGLVGDAKPTLAALTAAVSGELRAGPRRDQTSSAARCAELRARIRAGLEQQDRALELGVLGSIERALPPDAIGCWDMTILAYWAAAHLRLRSSQQFLYPLGSGTLGYAWPAAIGARVANPDRPVLAVVGDGGVQYALGELGTAAQHRIAAKLLIVDDGGYGILREYQDQDYGHTNAVELPGKDLRAVAAAYGLPARSATAEDLDEQLEWLLACDGPAVLVLRARLAAAMPTR